MAAFNDWFKRAAEMSLLKILTFLEDIQENQFSRGIVNTLHNAKGLLNNTTTLFTTLLDLWIHTWLDKALLTDG